MGNSSSNEINETKYKVTNSNTTNQINIEKKEDCDLNELSLDFDSIEPKQYNYIDKNHKPPFPDEYYSEFIIPKEYICEKTKKPFYSFMSEIIGNKGKNLIHITESNNMCYIWHNKEKDIIQIWGSKDKHKTIHTYLNNLINSHLKYEAFLTNKYKILRNLNKIILQKQVREVFKLLKKNS
tara:strand:- start:442 stop:984 length:543 start_codon:yes stop_codon:yes gene_type:complete